MVRRALFLPALMSAMFLASAGRATDLPKDVQRSVALYEQGRKLVESGDCGKAVPLFEESIRYNESIGAHLSIAECRSDNPLAAWREFKVAETLARRKEDERTRYAHEHAAALEGRLAMIRVLAPLKSRVTVDAKPIDPPEDPVAVEPGSHQIEIVRPDGVHVTKTVRAVQGETVRVNDEPEPKAPPPAPHREPEPDHSRQLTGIIVGGAGVGLAVVGGVFGLLASSKLSDAKSACADYPHCPPDKAQAARDANDSGRTDALLSTIGIGVGVAAIALGAVLYFTAPKMISQGGFSARF